MAKLNRERRLLDKRLEKQARKDARKRAAELGETVDAQGPVDEALTDDEPSVDPA